MRTKETGRWIRLRSMLFAVCMTTAVLAGCGGGTPFDETTASAEEEIGFDAYENTKSMETEDVADDALAAEDVAEPQEAEDSAQGAAEGESAGEQGKDGASPLDGKDKKLVYEGSVAIDAIEFETSVRAFKETVQEHGGFLENEQSYGGGSKYTEESSYGKADPRSFRATARIPSDSYQDFMEQTEGLGKVTESNSKVTNMTRQYGTLKAELEIYEAEYARYLKMFDEVSEDNAMLAIQEKLTELSLDIARTKSEMSVIDTDASYSIVNVSISEVAVYEESSTSFPQRLGDVLAKSWTNMLKFFENLLFFLILHWYKLLLLFLIVWLIVKFVKKQQAKSAQKRQQMMHSYQNGQRRQGAVPPSQPQMGAVKTGQPQMGTEQPGQPGTNSVQPEQSGTKSEDINLSESRKEGGGHHE